MITHTLKKDKRDNCSYNDMKAMDDLGFVFAIFSGENVASINYCFLARETYTSVAYTLILPLLLSLGLMTNKPSYNMCFR
jgi:hypothetical protein